MPRPAVPDRSVRPFAPSPNPDTLVPIVFGLALLGAAIVYAAWWAGALSGDESLGARPELFWLHAHILAYLVAQAILLSALGLTLYLALTAANPRLPWLEAGVLCIALLLMTGVYTGFRFARPAWGFNPWRSDGKLLIALGSAAFAALVLVPLAIWMRIRVDARRRHFVLAAVLFGMALLSAVAFFYPGRTMHPAGTFLP